MKSHLVKVHPEKDLLACKMAQLAEHRAELDSDAVEMVINRIILHLSTASIASFPARLSRYFSLAGLPSRTY